MVHQNRLVPKYSVPMDEQSIYYNIVNSLCSWKFDFFWIKKNFPCNTCILIIA